MATRLTTEGFIEKARAVHGDMYDYSMVVYSGSKNRVQIACNVHGIFWQIANVHSVKGGGCPDCAIDLRARDRSHTEIDFIAKAKSLHGDKYSYSNMAYFNTRSKIEILCNTCSTVFWQSPNAHTTAGQGCPGCAIALRADDAKLEKEDFIIKAKAAHGNKYDYSSVIYTGSLNKVEIGCREHGSFWQRTNAHLTGSIGCTFCTPLGGYRNYKSGYFYILSDGYITKVGITNLTVEKRMKSISKSSKLQFVKNYSVYFADGTMARDLEKAALRVLRLTYKQPSEVFDGSTEAFISVDIPRLLVLVKNQIDVLTDTK